jgi:hypothetical protein
MRGWVIKPSGSVRGLGMVLGWRPSRVATSASGSVVLLPASTLNIEFTTTAEGAVLLPPAVRPCNSPTRVDRGPGVAVTAADVVTAAAGGGVVVPAMSPPVVVEGVPNSNPPIAFKRFTPVVVAAFVVVVGGDAVVVTVAPERKPSIDLSCLGVSIQQVLNKHQT